MNTNLPALIHCPFCKERRDSVNLGSVTTEGYVIVKQKFGRHMMVMAQEYSLICDCGYYIHITDGKVTASALPGTQLTS